MLPLATGEFSSDISDFGDDQISITRTGTTIYQAQQNKFASIKLTSDF